MALTDKLTAIADAIRNRTNKNSLMTLDEMPTEIASIDRLLLPAEYPDYVRTEAQRVATEVRNVLTDDSIVSICMSDTHYFGNYTTSSTGIQNNEGCRHAAMAAKALTYLIPVDFFVHTGDVSQGAGDTTIGNIKTQIEEMVGYFRESGNTFPMFICIGNHDINQYYHDAMITAGNTGTYTLDGNYLFENFTKHSNSDDTVFSGEDLGGYCYRDFADKKLRIFMLNSMDYMLSQVPNAGTNRLGYTYDRGPSETQQLWVAQALQELNTKDDATDWGFIVLCHYPLDYGDARPISKVFMQYVNGGSITLNGTTVNFNGVNNAKFICQHHGHVHNFLVDKLHALNNGIMEEYDAWRIGIPNAQYDRENYYDSYYGISFKQDVSYNKTPGTFEDTSFVVNVYNRSDGVIYSFAYGACSSEGDRPDRVITINAISYSVTQNLTNVTSSNNITTAIEGYPYETALESKTGYILQTPTIIMGGTDVTSTAWDASTGKVSISNVTGDITITAGATAISYAVTNTLSNVTNSNSASTASHDSAYNATLAAVNGYKISSVKVTMGGTDVTSSVYSNGVVNIAKVTGAIAIIATAIEATYVVTYNLSNVTSSNTAAAVQGTSAQYSTTLSSIYANGKIRSATVTMGGTDVTSTVYDSTTGVVSISNVTGDVVITAIGVENLLLSAIDVNGDLYNGGAGYKSGVYIKTSTGAEIDNTGMCASGFIPVSPNQTLIMYNVGRAAASSATNWAESYIIKYISLGTAKMSGQIVLKNLTAQADGSLRITADELVPATGSDIAYIRLTSSYLGDDTLIYVE